ncbi:DUF4244 domain-containing protein [Pseudonocardia sp. HH130629-09]|uniref:DUF4244 domain-containing protein n=1 Tax=Pseudonocardia sp. HH130629-09 TaxID=1641402 RepID=UPI0032E458EE
MAWRSRLWEFTGLKRLRNCGRVAHTSSGGAIVRVSQTADGPRAGLSGLQSCGSPWSCPVCARKIGAERSAEVARALTRVAADGGSAALVTLTMRHDRGHRLADLWDALSAAWTAVTSGSGWTRDQKTFGVVGWVRTVEVTHGAKGWHVHVHSVVALDGPTSPEMMWAMGDRMFARWERSLSGKGFSAVADKGGLDVRPVRMTGESIEQVSDYISKITAEITSPSTKDGRKTGNRSPFAILRDALATGLADDLDLWFTWEQVSHGRRQLTWSRSLRALAGAEKSDDDIASEDKGGDDLLTIPRESWERMRHDVADLLDAVEIGGVEQGVRWMRSRGLGFRLVSRGDVQAGVEYAVGTVAAAAFAALLYAIVSGGDVLAALTGIVQRALSTTL